MKLKRIAINIDGDFPVTWMRRGNLHVITYGAQVSEFFDDVHACHEFGECVRHSLECAGKLDYSKDTDHAS